MDAKTNAGKTANIEGYRLIAAIVDAFLPAGLKDSASSELQRGRTLIFSCLLISFFAFVFCLLTLMMTEFSVVTVIFVVGSPLLIANLWLYRMTGALNLVGSLMIGLLLLALGGIAYFESGFRSPALLWLFPVPIIAAFVVGSKMAFFSLAIILIEILTLYFLDRNQYPFPQVISESAMQVYEITGRCSVVLFLGVLGWYYDRIRRLDLAQLAAVRDEALDAKREAIAANQAKSVFLSTMSHELRTPLNGILGMVQLMNHTQLSANQRELVATINESGNGLLNIINDILDLSKIEADKMQLAAIGFDLGLQIAESINIVRPLADNKSLQLHLQFSALEQTVLGDPFRLRQIILNLLTNAVKFTDEGSVTIHATAKAVAHDQISLDIAVIDTGIGIARSHLEHLFDAFTQADAAMNRKFEGTGLGLTICKKLVEAMGGTISVQSELGVGSRFYCSIPFKQARPTSKDANQEAHKIDSTLDSQRLSPILVSAPNARILVAEDNRVNQLVIKKMLEQIGYGCRIVSDGLQLMRVLEQDEDWNLIIMDCQMPNMDGYEATKAIRQLASDKLREIPIIAVTANAVKGESEKCLSVGMNDYIAKPVEMKILQTKIAHHLILEATV